jgi:hypothetical protein
MKISDIITDKAALENLSYRKKSTSNIAEINKEGQTLELKDIFDSDKIISPEMTKMDQLQKSFVRDNLSLNGLYEMQNKVRNFESSTSSDYDQLTRELNAVINSTKFNGENVISYLSTNIQDNKSLYTFKSNLDSSIVNTQAKVAEERKNLALYLVKRENIETAASFSSEKTVRNIMDSLKGTDARYLHKDTINASSLLGLEK